MSPSSERLNALVVAINKFSKTDMTNSEANTKKKIIEPLLELLGWDTRSNEVMLEYPIKIGSTIKHVDYALILEDKPVAFVEAKAFNVALSSDDSSQIISYGRIEDVRWAILTNGRILKVFDTRKGKTENACLLIGINLEKLPMHANALKLISKEFFLTGELERMAKRLASAKVAIKSLRQKRKETAEKFQEILLQTTGIEVKEYIKNISKQLVEQTIQLLEKQLDKAYEDKLREKQTEKTDKTTEGPDLREFWKQLLKKSNSRTNLFVNASPGIYGRKDKHIDIGKGRGNYSYILNKHLARVEFCLDSGNKAENKRIFDELYGRKRQIEEDFGEELEWLRQKDKCVSRIAKVVANKGSDDIDYWPMIQDKLVDAMVRLERALDKHISELT